MCGCGCNSSANVIDVRAIDPRMRHQLIFHRFDQLNTGDSFLLVNDHDPQGLRMQFEAALGHRFAWEYEQQGPEVWKVRISKLGCCGSCA